jgi:uncharacterized membrane protein
VSDLALFAGRFHPLLVHFPIALLLLAALLHLVVIRARARRPDGGAPTASALGLVLWLGASSAVVSAIAGLLLGSSGGYGGDTYSRHQWLGLGVAATSLMTALLWTVGDRGRRWPRAQAGLVAIVVVLLTATGHLGAMLTHGEGYLAEHAPSLLRGLLGGARQQGPPLAGRSPESIKVFEALVAPVLQKQCVSCHGPAKAEGGLRLDTPQGIAKGGDDGPVVAPGRAVSSELIRRVWLPASHEDAMPPAGHRPLSPADALVLRWWIDQGARTDLTLADAEIGPDVAPVIEALVGPISRGGPTLPAVRVAPATREAIAAVTARGFVVEPVADGMPFLHVHATNAAARIDDEAVAALTGLAPQIVWLDLAATRVTDAGLATLARLPNLTRVHLQRTAVGDAGLARLGGLAHVEYLNLYGTRVTDEGLARLSTLKGLRTLYVWRTAVTPAGAARLTSALPRLTVETGAAVEVPAPAVGARR